MAALGIGLPFALPQLPRLGLRLLPFRPKQVT